MSGIKKNLKFLNPELSLMGESFDWTKEHDLTREEGRDKLKSEGPKAPKVAPDPDDKASALATSRKLQRKTRSGRTSTVLTPSNTLG